MPQPGISSFDDNNTATYKDEPRREFIRCLAFMAKYAARFLSFFYRNVESFFSSEPTIEKEARGRCEGMKKIVVRERRRAS